MKVYAVLLFILCSLFAQSQFTDSTPRYIRLSAAGNINRSNSITSFLFSNDARFSIKSRHTTLNTSAGWLYGEQGTVLTNNDFNGTADFNFYRDSSNFYYWALANYVASYSLKIRNQVQGGFGLAYNAINRADAWLNISEGILYEASHLTTSDATRNEYQTFRNSLRLSYKFAIKKTSALAAAITGNRLWASPMIIAFASTTASE